MKPVYWGLKWNQCTGGWNETSVLGVEMKPVYWGLKWNQGTMVKYVSICFNMIELMCYADDWGIDLYIIIMVEMIPVYWGLKGNQVPWLHIHLYVSVWLNWCGMCDNWVICSYVIILVEMKPIYWRLKRNQGIMVTYAPISLRMVEIIWLLLWLNDESICNHIHWNEIRVLGIERNSRYGDCKWIIVKSIDLE